MLETLAKRTRIFYATACSQDKVVAMRSFPLNELHKVLTELETGLRKN